MMDVLSNPNSSLESDEFDPIEYLNLIFPQPSSLGSASSVYDVLNQHRNYLCQNITLLSVRQAQYNDASLERLQNAKSELAELFTKIESVQTRAFEIEQTITSMTADIKRLDGTKSNLTLSMTALKRLQMLTTAYEQLRGLAKTRQYRECGGLLQAVLQLMKHFNSYRSINQIATLSRNVADLQRELLEQVCEDFEICFARDEFSAKKSVLAEACLVIDALGSHARARLVTWYINTQLREYRKVFRGNDEAGSLDNIGRRYSWLKRMLSVYEDKHIDIFPKEWRVDRVLAKAFCDGTRDDFKGILEKSIQKIDGSTVDVNLLLSCLQETMDFELILEKRFATVSRASLETLTSPQERGEENFERSISQAFEPYLSVWVESQDKLLASTIPKYRNQDLLPPDEEFSSQAVIASSIELFRLYKTILSKCAKLSTGERLLDLSKVLAKYLDEYAQLVLLHFVHPTAGSTLRNIILVLNTADYCHTNTQQLEDSLKKRIDVEFLPKVDFSPQTDLFMGVASAVILALVQKVELACEAPWREMRNITWSKMESVGDQSSYVAELLRNINSQSQEILSLIAKQQYARAFCDNLVEHLATAYINNIVQCKPISEVGAEQMLLDKYVMTKSLETLLTFAPHPFSTSASANFTKRIQSTLSRVDPLLKTLQVRPVPPEALVQAYIIHISDCSENNFRKILELKGIPKSQQHSLVELFTVHRDGKPNSGLQQMSPLLTPLMNTGNIASSGLGMAAAGSAAAGSGKAFDPTGFGEKFFSAARETGERIGGEETKTTMEGNLKSIGKFFRIETSGFGRFGQNWQGTADENPK